MAAEIHRITQETLDKLKAEYHQLTTVGRTEIARVIESARAARRPVRERRLPRRQGRPGQDGVADPPDRPRDPQPRDRRARRERPRPSSTPRSSQVVYEGDADDDVQEFFIGSIEEKPEGVLVASPTSPLGRRAARPRRRRPSWSTRRPRACCASRSSGCAEWPGAPSTRRSGTSTSSPSPPSEPPLLYVDLHLIHEVTSPQAFDGLRLAGRAVRRPDLHPRDGRPQRADRPALDARHRPDLATPARGPRGELRGVRHHRLPARPREPGHRPRHRTRARASPSRA